MSSTGPNTTTTSMVTTSTMNQHVSALAPPLKHDSVANLSSSTTATRNAKTFPTFADDQQDIESGNTLARLSSRLSGMSNDDQQDLVRRLSRRSTHRSQVTSMSPDDDEESNEFNDLLAEIFDRDEMKKKNVGVLFKDFTVEGQGVGAAIAPTVGQLAMKMAMLPLLPILLPVLLVKKCVTKAKGGKHTTRTLINKFNGCVRDGEMLLVLGQPGSGCTTFLRALANQRTAFKSVTGDVTYGGIGWEEMGKKYRGEVVYNQEDDLHYSTLSVEQTLRFALKTRTPADRPAGESRNAYQLKFLDVLGKIFGITHTFATKVGDEMIRGVSGGEKKRVSIAEVFVNRASVGCWDNSTRGLDASTAVEYCRSLRVLTNIAKVSTIVTIYQAGEQLYEFFDKVLLIDGGKCIYYGPAEEAKAYFENLGFVQEPRQTTADFLTSITDIKARRIKDGANPPRTAAGLEEAYRKSAVAEATLADMANFESQFQKKHMDESFRDTESDKKGKRHGVYALSFPKQVWYCTVRQYQINFGDKFALFGKNASAVFQGLIIGSLFYDMPKNTNGAFLRGGVLFFSLLFNALLALAELSSAFSSRPILMKHKSFTFYRPAAYALAQVVADLPIIFFQIAAFDIVIYFLSHLQYTPSQFFINFLFLYICTLSMYSFFRMLGSLVPSLDAATALSGVAIQALIVYAGYIIPRPSMHPWFVWIFYINPLAYGFESLMVNEFYNLELTCVEPRLAPFGPGGPYTNQGCAIAGSTTGSTVVQGAAYISESFQYTRSHLWRNLGIIIGFFIFFVVMTCIGTERQKPFANGGGGLVYLKGKEPKEVKEALAGETAVDAGAAAQQNEIKDSSTSSENSGKMDGFEKSETTFTWQNVSYAVPDPANKGQMKTLTNKVSGWVKPGQLTCLVGASGAGKTTLLNTLAQRQSTGIVTGDMLVDGRHLPKSFQRSTGYCEQMDIHEPTATVREALQFSALLRQPRETPTAEKYEYVEEIIKLLEMEHIADAVIGSVGAGLSVEQRKRVTLGVELASKPSLLLFLDEPTSGLDSQSAWNIVRFLRKLAEAGQALLVTIHQPSAILFQEFDNLLLLGPGGNTIYFGEIGHRCQTMIEYFHNNGSDECPKDANPAEWILDVVGAGGGIGAAKAKQDWPSIWKESEEAKHVHQEIQRIRDERGGSQNKFERDTREFAMPLSAQIMAVTRRIFIAYWRTPQYAMGKLMLHITTGLFNCFTFFQLGRTVQDQQNRLFSLFLVLTIAPPLIQQLQPRYLSFRALFTGRERQSKIYSFIAICFGSILVEIPYSIFCGTVFFCCWFFGPFPMAIVRDISRAGSVWLFVSLFEIFYVTLGIMIACIAPTPLFASLLVPTFFSFIIAFCGVLSPPSAMPYFWRSWMYPLTPFHYLLESLLTLVEHNNVVRCATNEFARFVPANGQTCQAYAGQFVSTVGGYLNDPNTTGQCEYCQYATGDQYTATLQVYWSHRWRNYGIFWGYIIFNIFMIFFLTYLYTGGLKSFTGMFSKRSKGGSGEKRRDLLSEKGNEPMAEA